MNAEHAVSRALTVARALADLDARFAPIAKAHRRKPDRAARRRRRCRALRVGSRSGSATAGMGRATPRRHRIDRTQASCRARSARHAAGGPRTPNSSGSTRSKRRWSRSRRSSDSAQTQFRAACAKLSQRARRGSRQACRRRITRADADARHAGRRVSRSTCARSTPMRRRARRGRDRIPRERESRPAAATARESRVGRRAVAHQPGDPGCGRAADACRAWYSTKSMRASAAASPRSSDDSCARWASARRSYASHTCRRLRARLTRTCGSRS